MKVALLIWNPQNRELLTDALRGECDVLPPEAEFVSSEADLVIVDGPALTMSSRELRAAKQTAEPLFLPVLFIASRPDVTRTSPRLWQLVDDVITRPLLKQELQARVRALLHARRLSLRLRESRIMYEREHLIAESFQHAALPNALPALAGFDFDGIYEPADDEAQLGGDWYDAVTLCDGRIVISIGDVSGVGLQAAVTMASVRQAIRAVAQVYADPITLLDAADRTLKEERPGRIVTAFVGVIDPIAETITYCSAGHPPPLLRDADGTLRELRAQSLPLGLRIKGDGSNHVTPLRPGMMLCFYTDGLSEVSRDLFESEQRLHAAFSSARIESAEHPASEIKAAVYDGSAHRDDVAILTVRMTAVDERDGVFRWYLDSANAHAASAARREVVRRLAAWGVPAESLFSCELIFGELIANVVDYAPGRVQIVLDGRLDRPVLHMLDEGDGFTLVPRLPTDLLSERGRGLFLIWTLSDDFNVDVRLGGGAHARAVLPVDLALLRAVRAARKQNRKIHSSMCSIDST